MGRESARDHRQLWRLAGSQHGVLTRRQLLDVGFSSDQIDGRVRAGRLHRLWRGVYAVGRPRLTCLGWWLAAVLACGDHAVLSHKSAGQLWGILATKTDDEREHGRPPIIHVSVPAAKSHRRGGIRIHRRRALPERDRSAHRGIPVTSPARTLLDLASAVHPGQLEAAINESNACELIDPESLRDELEVRRGAAGAPALRRILDQHTFSLTDSELERRFLDLVRRAKLPKPQTQQRVAGFRVDFFWPERQLVVETDGLRYHRTAAQQSKDRHRDRALIAAGFTVLRFTHAQVQYRRDDVVRTLRRVLNRS
jgi:very-short-patch-repair endonuclease